MSLLRELWKAPDPHTAPQPNRQPSSDPDSTSTASRPLTQLTLLQVDGQLRQRGICCQVLLHHVLPKPGQAELHVAPGLVPRWTFPASCELPEPHPVLLQAHDTVWDSCALVEAGLPGRGQCQPALASLLMKCSARTCKPAQTVCAGYQDTDMLRKRWQSHAPDCSVLCSILKTSRPAKQAHPLAMGQEPQPFHPGSSCPMLHAQVPDLHLHSIWPAPACSLPCTNVAMLQQRLPCKSCPVSTLLVQLPSTT